MMKLKQYLISLRSKLRKLVLTVHTEINVRSPHWPAHAQIYGLWFNRYRINVEDNKIEVVNGEIDKAELEKYMGWSDHVHIQYEFEPPTNPAASFTRLKEENQKLPPTAAVTPAKSGNDCGNTHRKERGLMEQPVEYDANRRMKYHPDYHDSYKQPYDEDDLIYLVTTYRRGKKREVAAALGRTEASVADKVCKMRKSGQWELYQKRAKEMDS